nr:DUF3800 domain-containing protein [uncultured Lachnoanaerobaculum sp.]
MVIYIDESGSINNHISGNEYFIIALVRVVDKDSIKKSYKRFVSSNFDRLLMLDCDKVKPSTGQVIKEGGKMFCKGSFRELKGSQLDKKMKQKFVDFFVQKHSFELYYIIIDNKKLTDRFCENTARVFNYTLRLGLEYFISTGYLQSEDCILQLDERNEKTESKYFLENYLNTELSMNGTTGGKFAVQYFDSANNNIIQIADVFANLYYSHMKTGGYKEYIQKLKDAKILKCLFKFPV